MTIRSLLTACLLLLASRVAAQTTVPIDVHSGYLHIDQSDTANYAVAIDLASIGVLPGYTISLQPVGDWDAGPGGDEQTGLLGVFSANATLLPAVLAHRVPGAIDAGIHNFSGGTYPHNEPTDIIEDLYFLSPGIEIVVPPGATHLFVTPADIYYIDNADPDGDLAVRISITSTTGIAPGENVGSGAVFAAPNPFHSATSIGFRLESSASIRLTVHDIGGRRVRTLISAKLPPGDHRAAWDGRDAAGRSLPAGTYFARLERSGRVQTTRMSLVR